MEEGEVTGDMLLAALDVDGLLKSAELKAGGPRFMITEKVKELKGDILALAAFSLLFCCQSFPQTEGVWRS